MLQMWCRDYLSLSFSENIYFLLFFLVSALYLKFCPGGCPGWDWLQDVLWLSCLLLLWLLSVNGSCDSELQHNQVLHAHVNRAQSRRSSFTSSSKPSLFHYKTLALSYYWLLLKSNLINSTPVNSTFLDSDSFPW